MSALARYRQIGIAEAARRLELHPFEVVRILVADGSLPGGLRLEPDALEGIRRIGGLQTWWSIELAPEGNEPETRAYVRALLRRMLDEDLVEPRTTRADNLFRGLADERQRRLRQSVNALIQHGCLFSQMSATGLAIGIRSSHADDVRVFAVEGIGLVDRLWNQA